MKSLPAAHIPVDVVLTPFGSYMVVQYVDGGFRTYQGGAFDFSGPRILPISAQEKGLVGRITELFRKYPSIEVFDDAYWPMSVSPGKVGDILSRENMQDCAERYLEGSYWERRGIMDLGGMAPEPSTVNEAMHTVKCSLVQRVWEQLIRRSSKNWLPFETPTSTSPHMLIYDEQERGFAIADTGINSKGGCGDGVIRFYQIASENGPYDGKIFSRNQLRVHKPVDAPIHFLAPSEIASRALMKEQGPQFRDYTAMLKNGPCFMEGQGSQPRGYTAMLDNGPCSIGLPR